MDGRVGGAELDGAAAGEVGDLGCLVALGTDPRATGSAGRQAQALAAIRGHCRQVAAAPRLAEVAPAGA